MLSYAPKAPRGVCGALLRLGQKRRRKTKNVSYAPTKKGQQLTQPWAHRKHSPLRKRAPHTRKGNEEGEGEGKRGVSGACILCEAKDTSSAYKERENN